MIRKEENLETPEYKEFKRIKEYMHPAVLEIINRAKNIDNDDLARIIYEEALKLANEYADIVSMAYSLMNLGDIMLNQNKSSHAMQYYSSSYALLQQRGWFEMYDGTNTKQSITKDRLFEKYRECENNIFKQYYRIHSAKHSSVTLEKIDQYLNYYPTDYNKYKEQLRLKKLSWNLINEDNISITDLYRMNREIIDLLQTWLDEAREYFRWLFYEIPTKYLRLQIVGLGNFATYDSPSYHNLKFAIVVSSGQRDYENNKNLLSGIKNAQNAFIRCVQGLLILHILSLGETRFLIYNHNKQKILNDSISPEGFGLDPLFLEISKNSAKFIKDVEDIKTLSHQNTGLPDTIPFTYPELEISKLRYWHNSLYLHPAPFLANMRMHFGYNVLQEVINQHQENYNQNGVSLAKNFCKSQSKSLESLGEVNIFDNHSNNPKLEFGLKKLTNIEAWLRINATINWRQKIEQANTQNFKIELKISDRFIVTLVTSKEGRLKALKAIEEVCRDVNVLRILKGVIRLMKHYLIALKTKDEIRAYQLNDAVLILLDNLGIALGGDLIGNEKYPCIYQGNWHLKREPSTYYHSGELSLFKWYNNNLIEYIGASLMQSLREVIMLHCKTHIAHETNRLENKYMYKCAPSSLNFSDCKGRYKSLAFEGGGPKGYGYVGALQTLKEAGILKDIKSVAGTSAGAITALFLALGYKGKELYEKMEFFATMPCLKNLAYGAWYDASEDPAESNTARLKDWVSRAIKEKVGTTDITFIQLHNLILQGNANIKDLYVFVANINANFPETMSHINSPDMSVCDAVVTSASVPLATSPKKLGDQKYVDGGVFENYPIDNFDWHLGPYIQGGDIRKRGNKSITNLRVLGFKADTNYEISMFRDRRKPFNEEEKEVFWFTAFQDAGEGSQNVSFIKKPDDVHRTIFINMRYTKVTTSLNLYPNLKNGLRQDSYEATKLYLFRNLEFKKLCEENLRETKYKLETLFYRAQFIKICPIDNVDTRILYFLDCSREQAKEVFDYIKVVTSISFMHLWNSETHEIIDIIISEVILETMNIIEDIQHLEESEIKKAKTSKINQNIGVHEVTIEEFWKASSFPVGQKYGHLSTNTSELREQVAAQNSYLYQAIKTNNIIIASDSLIRGANPESGYIENNKTTSCLYLACSLGHTKIIELLLRNDNGSAEPNRTNSNGLTPLDIAFIHGHKDIILLLLKANATTCSDKRQSIEYVEMPVHQEIVTLLLKHNDGLKLKSVSI